MSQARPPVLRHVRSADAAAVLDAFAAEDMSRQGDVHDETSAAAYTQRLVENPRAFGLDDGGRLVGVVGIDVITPTGWAGSGTGPIAPTGSSD